MISYSYTLNELAYKEYIAAYEWYELKQDGLGDKFMTCVEKKLTQIIQHPEHYGKRDADFREAKVKHFPYMIVYEIFKRKKIIHIAAIYHGKRNTRKKYRKLK